VRRHRPGPQDRTAKMTLTAVERSVDAVDPEDTAIDPFAHL
jgi:hypothetical protein